MLEKFRTKIAHRIIKKKFLNKDNAQINFNQEIKSSKKVLLLLPQNEEEIFQSLIIADYLLTKYKDLTFFLNYQFRNSVDKYENATVITFHNQSKTNFFLPNKNFRKKIMQMNFDIVIDLNRNEDVFMSAITNIINSKIRIGFRKNNSEHYYNLLIENTSNDSKTNFNNLLSALKMF